MLKGRGWDSWKKWLRRKYLDVIDSSEPCPFMTNLYNMISRWLLQQGVVSKVKLPALKSGASREGNFLLYCAPCPGLKGGACGALAGQKEKREDEKYFGNMVTKRVPPAHFVNSHKSQNSIEIN